MHNIFEEYQQKSPLTEDEKEKIIAFWQAQAFFNIDTNHFKRNLSLLLDNLESDCLLLSVNHGATQPLYQLVYGGEYKGLHFVNAKNIADNNYADQVYNRLFMMGWVDKFIEMRIWTHGKITYSIGYQSPHTALNEWQPYIDINLNDSYQDMQIQPAPVLDFSDPIMLRRIKLERIRDSILCHPFDKWSNLNGGRSDSAGKILALLENVLVQNNYQTKKDYLSVVEQIAKILEGKTHTTNGSLLFGLGARKPTTVQLYKSILKEIEDDISELHQTPALSLS